MLLESKVSPPAKYFPQFASENSAGRKKKKRCFRELQIQKLQVFLNAILKLFKKLK